MDGWAWFALIGLGAFHGINPAMGWLFAVALGLHRKSRAVVALAPVPIALGHAAAIALALALLAAAGALLHAPALRALAGGLLIAWGAYHLARGHRHRLRVGMTASVAGLALWSFLMATAHGAGLMLAPVVLEGPIEHAYHGHSHQIPLARSLSAAVGAIAVHTLAMATTTAVVALAVYEWIGLAVLRWAWINLDRLWAGALIVAGVLVFVL